MIPVDLNRLREAREAFLPLDPAENHPIGIELMRRVTDAVDAVLDAPTVRWCETHESVAPFGNPNNCESWSRGAIGGCSISVRALVPVKGGQE